MSMLGAMWSLGAERPANACRYEPDLQGHVESYFFRANDPKRPRAFWLKTTILAPVASEPLAEAWCLWFDGERNRTWAHRETRPLRDARFPTDTSSRIEVASTTFELGARGSSQGGMRRGEQECRWELTWTRERGPIGEPLSIFPHHLMVEGPFPKSKLLTPYPALRFSGTIVCFGEEIQIDEWRGMQGHNWGREHAWEYAWGQCLFEGVDGAPDAMLEGFTGRIRLAGRTTPPLSALVVRRGEETYRFDRVLDFWRQEATLADLRWSLRLDGPDGTARLAMNAAGRPMVCLGYQNPDGRLSYCFNSKLAETVLQVEPRNGQPFACRSDFGGALEFLRNEPDARFPNVI